MTQEGAGSGRSPDATGSGTGGPRSMPRELDESEELLVLRAEQHLIRNCMTGKGFSYWEGPLPTVDDLKGGGYVLTDIPWAKRNGYGSRLEKRARELQRSDPNRAYANALPMNDRERYGRALGGVPSKGVLTVELPAGGSIRTPRDSCQADAKEQLYGDFETWFRAEKTVVNLPALYVPALVADKRFVSAVEEWSACMGREGYDYADPAELRDERPRPAEGANADKAFASEVALAVAEAGCANRTPLAGTARTLQAEYRKKLRQYDTDVVTYRRMRLDALARAEDLTGRVS